MLPRWAVHEVLLRDRAGVEVEDTLGREELRQRRVALQVGELRLHLLALLARNARPATVGKVWRLRPTHDLR
jgi:hypothetical protein